MKRTALALLICLLTHPGVALAAGPLEGSGRAVIQQLAQTRQEQRSNKRTLLWTGGALLGTGVWLMTVDPGDAHGNSGSGFGLAVSGATYLILGASKKRIQVGPKAVTDQMRF